jgi:hypothetical protein
MMCCNKVAFLMIPLLRNSNTRACHTKSLTDTITLSVITLNLKLILISRFLCTRYMLDSIVQNDNYYFVESSKMFVRLWLLFLARITKFHRQKN